MTTPITREELREAKTIIKNALAFKEDGNETLEKQQWEWLGQLYGRAFIELIEEWGPIVRGAACSNGPYDRPCCQARQSLGRFDAKTK